MAPRSTDLFLRAPLCYSPTASSLSFYFLSLQEQSALVAVVRLDAWFRRLVPVRKEASWPQRNLLQAKLMSFLLPMRS